MTRFPALVVVCLSFVCIAAAQLTVDVGLVNAVATVTDSEGRYVDGLTVKDFVLEEDGQVQTITHLTQSDDLPASLGIVLDTSGSMATKIKTATDAVSRFIRTIHKDDDIFFMTFDQRPALRQDFTNNREKLTSALKKVKLGGGTALYDAVDESLGRLKRGKHDKKAILLITDGEDTASLMTYDKALLRVRESGSLLYALGIAPDGSLPLTGPYPGGRTPPPIYVPPPIFRGPRIGRRRLNLLPEPQGGGARARFDTVNMDVLDALTDAAGGKAWLVSGSSERRGNEIERALDKIASELRSQYSIGYYPSHAVKDAQWHRIQIRVKNSNYKVRFRTDYFGG
jgi:Ca-activated chloride channel homolog